MVPRVYISLVRYFFHGNTEFEPSHGPVFDPDDVALGPLVELPLDAFGGSDGNIVGPKLCPREQGLVRTAVNRRKKRRRGVRVAQIFVKRT